jgi:excisionase family DNA binding protein
MTVTQELTVREAAQRTHRSEETIRRWIWSGRLPARKHGNSYRIDVVHLDQIAVAYDPAAGSHTAGSRESFRAWLDDLDRWKQGLPAASRVSAADLVIEDRHARR